MSYVVSLRYKPILRTCKIGNDTGPTLILYLATVGAFAREASLSLPGIITGPREGTVILTRAISKDVAVDDSPFPVPFHDPVVFSGLFWLIVEKYLIVAMVGVLTFVFSAGQNFHIYPEP